MNYFQQLMRFLLAKVFNTRRYLHLRLFTSVSPIGRMLSPIFPARRRPRIDGILIDVSGNLHVGSEPTPGAVEAFRILMKSGVPFRLCSNTSKESTADLVKRLDGMGFKVSEAARALSQDRFGRESTWSLENPKSDRSTGRTLVWTSIGAVAQTVKSMGLKAPYLLLSDSARAEVLASGHYDETADPFNPNRSGQGGFYDSVIVGLAPPLFDYEHLNIAFRVLKGETRPPGIPPSQVEFLHSLTSDGERGRAEPSLHRARKIPLITTHKAKYIQSGSGQLSLGPGPFVAALECAAGPGVQAHVVGKPTRTFFEMVINDFRFASDLELVEEDRGRHGGEISPEREQNHKGVLQGTYSAQRGDRRARRTRGKIAVIGDDIEADLGGGAIDLGLWRVLVKTGKYRPGDENRDGILPPDEVCDSFSAFVESFLRESQDRPEHPSIG